jgi:CBS domain containing-hemolysin-like protein
MIPLALFLLGCATIYVGTLQAGFSALMRLSLRLMAEKDSASDSLEPYLEDPARLFVPARLLLGLLLVAAASLIGIEIGMTSMRHAAGFFVAVLGYAVVCEHLVPWLIVRRDPQRVVEWLLPSFGWVIAALAPVAGLLGRVTRRRSAPAAAPPADSPVPAGDQAPSEATVAPIEGEERRLLRSIVDFGDRLVREVMTPRPDIVAIRAEATLEELRAFFREQEYSRIPVFKDSLDNVLGFVFVKDLMKNQGEAPDTPVTALMRPAYFVPETKRVPELLKEFQGNQVQSAIVVDEYGGTAGLVTLEDLIEEIVGEIRDEYDVETEAVVDQGDGSFVVSGKAHVEDLAERLGIEVEGEGFETVGGYLLSHLGRVPLVGESFALDDLSVEVLEGERRRIHKVRVRRREPASQTEA